MISIKHINKDKYIKDISIMITHEEKEINTNLKLATSLEYEAIKRSLQFQKSILLGAFDEDKCIGFIWAKFEQPLKEVVILNLFISSKYRGLSLGKQLKKEIEKWAISINATSIISTVHKNNKKMLKLNEELDYNIEKYILRKKLK